LNRIGVAKPSDWSGLASSSALNALLIAAPTSSEILRIASLRARSGTKNE